MDCLNVITLRQLIRIFEKITPVYRVSESYYDEGMVHEY